jgi:hypothetical protein
MVNRYLRVSVDADYLPSDALAFPVMNGRVRGSQSAHCRQHSQVKSVRQSVGVDRRDRRGNGPWSRTIRVSMTEVREQFGEIDMLNFFAVAWHLACGY